MPCYGQLGGSVPNMVATSKLEALDESIKVEGVLYISN